MVASGDGKLNRIFQFLISSQDGIVAHRNVHKCSAVCLSCSPKVALKTVPVSVRTLIIPDSRWGTSPLPFSTPLSLMLSVAWHSVIITFLCMLSSAPQLRLVNGTSSTGRLELWSDNFRGTVCARYWDDREATAACKGLGFNGGRFLGSNTYGQVS